MINAPGRAGGPPPEPTPRMSFAETNPADGAPAGRRMSLDPADGAGALARPADEEPAEPLSPRQERRRALRAFLDAPVGESPDAFLEREFARQGALAAGRWRATAANSEYGLCASYPAIHSSRLLVCGSLRISLCHPSTISWRCHRSQF